MSYPPEPPESKPCDSHLMESILAPLLEDFLHWFARSQTLLEAAPLTCLSGSEQQTLLRRVLDAQQEVLTVRTLLAATDGQVGVEVGQMNAWHRLVMDCWQVSRLARSTPPTV
jgi:Protein of unknown function (DUF2605)